ncbi:50S ribosomal protein L25 [Candidatus Cloacimonadota bacterium]
MNVKIEAQLRTKGKKSDVKNLRKQGLIPAVIYGEGNEGIMINLEKTPFMKLYKTTIGEMAFYDITVEGKTYNAIMKDKQVHPVTRDYMHIDFLEMHKGNTLTLEIPINYVGEAKGVHTGGSLDVHIRRLEVTCLPKDIPQDIEVDVSELEIGDSIHLGDIDLPNMETKLSDSTTLVAVRAPRAEVEEEPEVDEEGIEGEEGAVEGEEDQVETEETKK